MHLVHMQFGGAADAAAAGRAAGLVAATAAATAAAGVEAAGAEAAVGEVGGGGGTAGGGDDAEGQAANGGVGAIQAGDGAPPVRCRGQGSTCWPLLYAQVAACVAHLSGCSLKLLSLGDKVGSYFNLCLVLPHPDKQPLNPV